MNSNKVKICFAASSGGHYEQLMMMKQLRKEYDSFILTEKTDYKSVPKDEKAYYLPQVNRMEKFWAFKMIIIFFKSLFIYIKEKPDFVICTGVLATIPMCLICKFFKGKLIYLESFAKVTSPTLSGKLLYRYADQFYVQWESMLEIYPNAIFLGGIY
ncbi:PssD/Cps14F family polysaccharide biosynthesis glycosyltransferase [Clostridium perfringens]